MIMETILRAVFGFLISAALGFVVIPVLKRLKYGQNVRDDGPKSHLSKSGTPTMGGVIFLTGIVLIWVLFGLKNKALFMGVAFTLGFGIVGFTDDYIKIVKKRSLGLRAIQKLALQVIIALLLAFYTYKNVGTQIWIPFTSIYVNLGWLFVPFVVFFALGLVNGVNLTDGLDGLAASVSAVICFAYIIIFRILSKVGYVPLQNAEGIITFASGLGGCLLGFLLFNWHPAKVFMGDTGSLAIGGAISYLALMSNTSLLIPIIGGCYLASAVSVILQVMVFKLFGGKRLFKMAPLHHHFELGGMKETKVVTLYILTTLILCAVGIFALVV